MDEAGNQRSLLRVGLEFQVLKVMLISASCLMVTEILSILIPAAMGSPSKRLKLKKTVPLYQGRCRDTRQSRHVPELLSEQII